MRFSYKPIALYTVAALIAFFVFVEVEGIAGYAAHALPHLVLLTYWLRAVGSNYKLFSLALIGYAITDMITLYTNTYSSLPTSIAAIFSLTFLIWAFFSWRSGYAKRRAYVGLIVVAYGIGYFLLIEDTIPQDLLIPIAIYVTLDALLFVVVSGMKLRNSFSYVLCIIAVFIHLVSDGIYAYHFFVEELIIGEPIMGLMHSLSQGLFVIGILSENNTPELRYTGSTSK
ncbi:MAG: hypothetical protein HWE14_09745 [Flavobacteriia bacterium]|nr:hypothetical protein [Flavobacteriia bacterium]